MKRSEMQAKAAELQGRFRGFALVNPERAFGIGVLCGVLLMLLAPLIVPVLLTAAALVGVFWLLAEQEDEGSGPGVTAVSESPEPPQEPIARSKPSSESVIANSPSTDETGSVGTSTSSNPRSIGFSLVEGSVEKDASLAEIDSYKPARPKKASGVIDQPGADHQDFSKSEASTEPRHKSRKPRKADLQKTKDSKARRSSTSTQNRGAVKKSAADRKSKQ